MRARTATAASLLLLTALAGCKSAESTVSTTAETGAAKPSATAAASSAAAKPAAVGDTIAVSGFNGEKLNVALVKVFPDAKGADEFTNPDAGKSFYAVQLRITDAGKSAYSDSPDNSVTLKDASGQQFQPDLADVTAGQSFAGSVNIAPGDSVLGVVVFQVPNGDKPVKLQFTPDSGMADSTAQWNLS